LIIAHATKPSETPLVERVHPFMKQPPTAYYTEFLMLCHHGLHEPWEITLPQIVDVCSSGLSDASMKVVGYYEQALDVAFNHYRESHPQFSSFMVNQVVAAMPHNKLYRVVGRGLKPTSHPDHIPGDHIEISAALSEEIRLAIESVYPEGRFFSKHLTPAKNLEVYRRMGWKEALNNMKESDREGQFTEDLGL
jgi:hypothetical protein